MLNSKLYYFYYCFNHKTMYRIFDIPHIKYEVMQYVPALERPSFATVLRKMLNAQWCVICGENGGKHYYLSAYCEDDNPPHYCHHQSLTPFGYYKYVLNP